MTLDGSGGVAERFGDDGHGREFGEFVECSQSRGPGAEQLAEPRCEVPGVDVTSGRYSAEYPVGAGVRGGHVMAWICSELPPRPGQWIRQSDLDCPEPDGDQFFGDGHVVPG